MIDRIVGIRPVVQSVAVRRIMTFSPIPSEDYTSCKELYLAEKTGASWAKNFPVLLHSTVFCRREEVGRAKLSQKKTTGYLDGLEKF